MKTEEYMNTEEYSAAVLEVLRTEGWIQGASRSEEGYCLMGASGLLRQQGQMVGSELAWYSELIGLLGQPLFVEPDTQAWSGGLAEFNDHPSTTLEDVELLLKRHMAGERRERQEWWKDVT